jgi:hypothetical protein
MAIEDKENSYEHIEEFINLLTKILKVQEVFFAKKQGFKIEFEILDNNKEINKIEIDAKDFFDQIPDYVINDFISGLFVALRESLKDNCDKD